MSDLAAFVTRYLESREFGPRTELDGVAVIAVGVDDDHHRLVASVRRVGPEGGFVVIDVRSRQAVVKEQWPQVLTSCNLWNARMRVPKAWLDAGGTANEAHVVLEGCVPGSGMTQAMFDSLADGVIIGARSFWHWVDVHASW